MRYLETEKHYSNLNNLELNGLSEDTRKAYPEKELYKNDTKDS